MAAVAAAPPSAATVAPIAAAQTHPRDSPLLRVTFRISRREDKITTTTITLSLEIAITTIVRPTTMELVGEEVTTTMHLTRKCGERTFAHPLTDMLARRLPSPQQVPPSSLHLHQAPSPLRQRPSTHFCPPHLHHPRHSPPHHPSPRPPSDHPPLPLPLPLPPHYAVRRCGCPSITDEKEARDDQRLSLPYHLTSTHDLTHSIKSLLFICFTLRSPHTIMTTRSSHQHKLPRKFSKGTSISIKDSGQLKRTRTKLTAA